MFFALGVSAQDFFIDEDGNKVDCKQLTVSKNADGEVYNWSYHSTSGERKSYNQSNVPAFPAYSKGGKYFELIPEKIGKSEMKYCQRLESGTLSLYTDNAVRSYAPTKGSAKQSGPNRLFIKTPDGTFLDANDKKSFKNEISPLIYSCRAMMNKRITGKLPFQEELANLIKAYNEDC